MSHIWDYRLNRQVILGKEILTLYETEFVKNLVREGTLFYIAKKVKQYQDYHIFLEGFSLCVNFKFWILKIKNLADGHILKIDIWEALGNDALESDKIFKELKKVIILLNEWHIFRLPGEYERLDSLSSKNVDWAIEYWVNDDVSVSLQKWNDRLGFDVFIQDEKSGSFLTSEWKDARQDYISTVASEIILDKHKPD